MFLPQNRVSIVYMTVLNYGDVLNMYAAPSTLKALDKVYHIV